MGRIDESDLDRAVEFEQNNPKRENSMSHLRYEIYKSATTLREVMRKGGSRGDIAHDVQKGFVKFLDGGPVPEPSADEEEEDDDDDQCDDAERPAAEEGGEEEGAEEPSTETTGKRRRPTPAAYNDGNDTDDAPANAEPRDSAARDADDDDEDEDEDEDEDDDDERELDRPGMAREPEEHEYSERDAGHEYAETLVEMGSSKKGKKALSPRKPASYPKKPAATKKKRSDEELCVVVTRCPASNSGCNRGRHFSEVEMLERSVATVHGGFHCREEAIAKARALRAETGMFDGWSEAYFGGRPPPWSTCYGPAAHSDDETTCIEILGRSELTQRDAAEQAFVRNARTELARQQLPPPQALLMQRIVAAAAAGLVAPQGLPPPPPTRARYSFPRSVNDCKADVEYECREDGTTFPPLLPTTAAPKCARLTPEPLGPKWGGPHALAPQGDAFRVALLSAVERAANGGELEELHLHHIRCTAELLEAIATLAPNIRVLSCAYCALSPRDLAAVSRFQRVDALDLRGSIDARHAADAGLLPPGPYDATANPHRPLMPYTRPLVDVLTAMPALRAIDLDGILDFGALAFCIDAAALAEARRRGIIVNLGLLRHC